MNVSDVTYHDVEGTADFQHVVGVELGDGYDWDSLQSWWSPSRRKFFWLSDSGCSCVWLGDGINRVDQFEVGNREELLSAVRRKFDESYSSRTGMATELLDALAKVKTFRAAKEA